MNITEKILIEDDRLTPDMRFFNYESGTCFYKPDNLSLQQEGADYVVTKDRQELKVRLIDGKFYWVNECPTCKGEQFRWVFSRCSKHDTCAQCGINRKDLKDTPWGHEKGFMCKPCVDKKLAVKIVEFQARNKGECYFMGNDRPICPNCGEEIQDVYPEDGEQELELECPSCWVKITVQPNISITYDTELVKEEKDNG